MMALLFSLCGLRTMFNEHGVSVNTSTPCMSVCTYLLSTVYNVYQVLCTTSILGSVFCGVTSTPFTVQCMSVSTRRFRTVYNVREVLGSAGTSGLDPIRRFVLLCKEVKLLSVN